MQMLRTPEPGRAARAGVALRVLVASPTGGSGPIAQALADLGALVEVETHLYDAVSRLLDDPGEAEMLVVDCDAYGGRSTTCRVLGVMAGDAPRVPVVMIVADAAESEGAGRSDAFITLCAPATAEALRPSFDAVFGGRRDMRQTPGT